MPRFRDLSLTVKIILVVGIPYFGGLLVATSTGYLCYTSLQTTRLVQEDRQVLSRLNQLEGMVLRSGPDASPVSSGAGGDPSYPETTENTVGRHIAALEQLVSGSPDRSKYVSELDRALTEVRRRGAQTGRAQLSQALEPGRELTRLTLADLEERTDTIRGRMVLADNILLWGMIIIAISGVFMIFVVARSIIRPIRRAVDLARSTSKGDLTRAPEEDRADEAGLLIASLNEMIDQLKSQNARLVESVAVLVSTARQVSSIVSDLKSGASRTSAAVAETTSTVTELNQSSEMVSERARIVAQSSESAVKVSSEGRDATQETVKRIDLARTEMESVTDTVARLREQSLTIEKIIKAVRDLADQSNLLAVNASIEAARAGEHGRGFSVVAQEIKMLADQSKGATGEVRSILGDIRDRIDEVVEAGDKGRSAVAAGSEQATVAGDSIRVLAETVEESARSAAVIDASSTQQAAGVTQVAQAMESVREAMDKSLVSTNQLEVAVKGLEDLSVSLKEMLEWYAPTSGETSKQELDIQIALGPALMASGGYAAPEAEKTYTRAKKLVDQAEEPTRQFSVLRGEWGLRVVRCELHKAHELAETCLDLAETGGGRAYPIWARYMLGMTVFHMGRVQQALEHFEKGFSLYDVTKRRSSRALQDPGVACLSYRAAALWMLGFPETAHKSSVEAINLAKSLSHPFSEAYALGIGALVSQLLRDTDEAEKRAAEATAITEEHSIAYWNAWGPIIQGWALAGRDGQEKGNRLQQSGLDTYRQTGAVLVIPYFLSTIADARLQAGKIDDGLKATEEALRTVNHTEERWFEPELKRLHGELLLRRDNSAYQAEAEQLFREATSLAKAMASKSLELRSAVSLARLLVVSDRRTEAQETLKPVYGSFNEGFDLPDLVDARSVLEGTM